MDPVNETSVPEIYYTTSGGNTCQLRLLENFSIHEVGIPHALAPLEALRSNTSSKIVATGELLPARDSDAGAARIAVVTGAIIDWCIEYGDKSAVWIITEVAWYQLGSPSGAYAATYESLQCRQELAVRCAAAIKREPDAAVEEIQQLVLGGGHGIGSNGRIFGLQQLCDEAPFLAAQMAALHQAGTFYLQQQVSSGLMPSFLAWLKRQAGIMAAQAAQQAAAASAAEARAAKRQRLSEQIPAAHQAGYGGGSLQQQAMAGQQTPAAATAPSAGTPAPGSSSIKPGKLKLSMQGAASGGFKPKIKLKGQILPQAAPAPQDMGSQIQGHPPGADSQGPAQQYYDRSGQQHAPKPKLKIAMPKGLMRNAAHEQQQRSQLPPPAPLQQQHSLPESKASWGCPPQQQLPTQRSWDQAGFDQQQQERQQQHYQQHDPYSGGYAEYHQQYLQVQRQQLTTKQQRQAAATAARQAAAAARVAAAAAKAEEAERRRKEQELHLQMKRQAEYTADIARGMPPLPTRTFRVPAAHVVELLQLWELCQAFGAALGIPPFSLEQLEAALMPGPLSEGQQQASAEVTFAAADAEARTAAQKAAADLAAAIAEATGQPQVKTEAQRDPVTAQPTGNTAGEPPASSQAGTCKQQEQQPAAEVQLANVHQYEAAGLPVSSQQAGSQQQPSNAVLPTASVGAASAEAVATTTGGDSASLQAAAPAAVQETRPDLELAPAVATEVPSPEEGAGLDDVAAVSQPTAGAKTSSSPARPAGDTAVKQGPSPLLQTSKTAEVHPGGVQQEQEPSSVKQEQQEVDSDGKQAAQSALADHVAAAAPTPAGDEASQQPSAAEVVQEIVVPQQAQKEDSKQHGSKQPGAVQHVKQEPAMTVAEATPAVAGEAPGPAQPAVAGETPGAAQPAVAGEVPGAAQPAVHTVCTATAAPMASADAGLAAGQHLKQPPPAELPQAPLQQPLLQQQEQQQVQAGEQQEQLQQHTSQQQLVEVHQAQQQSLTQQQQQQQQLLPDTKLEGQVARQAVATAVAPAPSTTSVGTAGQTAASDSVGAASPAVKKHLKFKVKLSGLNKQGSTPMQASPAAAPPAAPGTALSPFAAVAADATAVEPASAAAPAVDPAAAAAGALDAAAAAAAEWAHPGAEADGQEQYTALTLEKAAAAAAAAEADDARQQPDVGIADRLSQASSLLLRDVHTALLRLIDGTAPKPGTKKPRQPLVAKMCPPEGLKQQWQLMAQPHWACRVAYTIAAAPNIEKVEAGVQDVVNVLLTGNYASLPLDSRMSVLRALMELALMSDTFHAHLEARIEAYTTPKPLRADTFRAFAGVLGASQSGVGRGRGGYRGGGYSEGHIGPSGEAKRAALEKSERGTAGRMLEEWMEWLSQQEQQSMGLRVPLGVDYRERRYWLLGGVAGAWRVFCEEKDGQLWGFYEGEQLLHLAHWIACAAIESELPLLHTLCTMPWPYRPSLVLLPVASAATAVAAAAGADPPASPSSVAYWSAVATGSNGYGYGSYHLTPAEAGVVPLGPQLFAGLCVPHVQQLMSAWEMAKFRPDGYRGLLAPLLFGEADVPGGSMLASSEARLQSGMYSIVGAAPFYRPGMHSLLQQLGRVLDQAEAASSPEAYTQSLLSLEALLSHPQMQPAPLSSDWVTAWQQRWRESLQRCGPSSWEALLLHMAMLGRHMVVGDYAMGREGFMRIVNNCRCPLVFPGIGDEYYIVRSAVEAHLEKYSQLPDAATAPLPPAAEELGAIANVIGRLPPASCYKVIALVFCSYPMPEALRQQQRPPVAETIATAAAAAEGLDSILGFGDDDELAAMHAVGGTCGGTAAVAAGGGGTTAAAVAHATKHNSIATTFDSDGDDIGGLLDFDVDELMNDMDQQPGSHRLPSLPLPPLPTELQQHAAAAAGDGGRPATEGVHQQQQHAQPHVGPPVPGCTSSDPSEYRPPCMWALLSPVDRAGGPSGNGTGRRSSEPDFILPERFQQQQQDVPGATETDGGSSRSSRPYVALPFHIDVSLPDALVAPELYEAGAERSWLPGDRFSMYMGPKGVRVGGSYHKGTIMSVEEGEEYDPWQSITVLWDNDSEDKEHKVSPWQIEPDRDEIQKAADELRKADEVAAAAASEGARHQDSAATAAAAGDGITTADSAGLRGGRRRTSRNIDISSLIGAVDDDDEYNPFADGYSSDSDDGGRRRKGKSKGSGLTWGGDRGTKGSKRGREGDEDAAVGGAEGPSSKKSSGRAGGPPRLLAGTGPLGGNQWSIEQIKQQQGTHLTGKQQQTLAALVAGNTTLVAQLTAEIPSAPIHEQPFPTPLKAECLAALPCRTQFVTLVADYNISLRGQFNPPMWGNRDLDLYTLFMVVNVRGGYEAVCRTNRWGDVCRSMGCYKDASSGDAMRSCYEKASLVQFEQYVRRGGWEQDRQTARRPQAAQDDQAAAIEQVMRAGKAAAAAPPPPPPPPPVPVAPARPQLIALPAHLANLPLLTQPGGPTVIGLQAATGQIIVSATPQQFQALQLQLRVLAQQQGKAPAAPAAPVVIPAIPGAAGAPRAPQTQVQLLLRQQLLQQAQLQSAAATATGGAGVQVMPVPGAANPHLQALIQQQQLQKVAGVLPALPSVAPTLSGGLTLQQLQQLQQQQLKPGGAAAAPPGAAVVSLPKGAVAPAAGMANPLPGASTATAPPPVVTLPAAAVVRPAAGAVLAPRLPGVIPARPPAAPAQSNAQHALAGTGSTNFSALLDDL